MAALQLVDAGITQSEKISIDSLSRRRIIFVDKAGVIQW